MIPIIMSGDEIDGESLSLSVSADRSVFDVEIPQKTRVSDDSAAEMRFDSGDMDGGVLGSGGLSAVESEGTRVLEGEMGLDSGDGNFEVGKSEMEGDEVEVGGSTVKAEGLGFNGGNGSFGGRHGGIGDLVVRSEEGSGSVSSGCGYGEIKRKTEIDDRGDDNLFDEMECKVVRSEEVRVSLEPGSEIKREMEARVSDTNAEGLHFSGGNGGFDGGNDGMAEISAESDMEVVKERRDHDLNSSHHDVSTDAISGTWALDGGGSLSYGFEYGDMVWGKVKSHPWLPGHIFNEAFASSSVRRMRRDGHVLVAFFGDSSYGWFDTAELIHFEPNYAEKLRQTNSRNFMKAVEEATDGASRRTALGLACRCRSPFNFRLASVPGYFVVDVFDFEPGGVYSGKQVHVIKPSHKSALNSKIERPVPDDVAALLPTENVARDVRSEFETVQEGKIREIVMDNADSEPVNIGSEETSEQLITSLKAEKEELEAALRKEQVYSVQLKQELAGAETQNTDLTKELQSVHGQLAVEQSRCFKLEVDDAGLRQKLQNMETLQKEVELLQRQKAASEQAALKQKQSSGGVWGWLAGAPPEPEGRCLTIPELHDVAVCFNITENILTFNSL